MTNINSNVLDDIEQTEPVDQDIIKEPVDIKRSKDDIQIVVKNDVVKDDVTELSELDLQKLVEADVSFKLIGEHTAKIEDLEDMESMLVSQESISKSDVKDVVEFLSEFSRSKISVEQYTQTRTATNYKFTLNIVQEDILTMSECRDRAYDAYMQEIYTSASTIANTLHDRIIPDLISKVESFSNCHIDMIKGMSDNKNLVVPFDREFYNITKIPLDSFGLTVKINPSSFLALGRLLVNSPMLNTVFYNLYKTSADDSTVVVFGGVRYDIPVPVLSEINVSLDNSNLVLFLETVVNLLAITIKEFAEFDVSERDYRKIADIHLHVSMVTRTSELVAAISSMFCMLDAIYDELEKL
jgi:hypothetical protein